MEEPVETVVKNQVVWVQNRHCNMIFWPKVQKQAKQNKIFLMIQPYVVKIKNKNEWMINTKFRTGVSCVFGVVVVRSCDHRKVNENCKNNSNFLKLRMSFSFIYLNFFCSLYLMHIYFMTILLFLFSILRNRRK